MAWWDNVIGMMDVGGGYNTAVGGQAQLDAQKQALAQQGQQFNQTWNYLYGAPGSTDGGQVGKAIGYAQQYGDQGASALSKYYDQAMGQYGQAQGALGDANAQALGAMSSGYSQARNDLQGVAGLTSYTNRATNGLTASSNKGPYDTLSRAQQMQAAGPGQAYNALGQVQGAGPAYDVTGQQYGLSTRLGQGDALSGQLNAQSSALANRATQGVDLQADPGYAFRQQQGEQSIMRQAAAQGGRMGGATMKALADYNSGLASQEYGAAFNRQQQTNQQLAQIQQSNASNQLGLLSQQYGATGNVDTMRQQASLNQAGRSDQASQFNAQQYNSMLQDQAARGDTMALDALRRQDASSQFNAGQYNALLGDYGAQSNAMGLDQARRQDAMNSQAQQNQMQLATMGYGAQTQMGNLAYQYGGQQADIYGQYGGQMANLYGQQAGLASQQGRSLADLYSNMGSNMGNYAIGSAGAATGLSNQMMGAYQNYAQYPGMLQQGMANNQRQNLGTAAGLVASIYSDARVKENIRDATTDTVNLLESLRPVAFNYAKPAQYGEGEWLGILAQDLLQTPMGAAMVVKAPDGTLMVDIRKAVSALLGSVVVLQNEVMELRGRLDKVRG